jgi:hypothetical protein
MKHLWQRGFIIAAAMALFVILPAPAAAQGTVPPWKPMTLVASAERGPLPMVLDKEFCARQEKLHARPAQLSANPGRTALPPIMRRGVPGVHSETLLPPKS